MQVKELLAERVGDVVTVGRKTPIADAARIMTENGIGAVVVVDTGDKVAGILSERDILAAVGEIEKSLAHVTADELMTENVVTCGPDDSIIHAVLKFDTLGIRHLVVMDQGEMIGILSIRDILQALSRLIVDQRIFNERKFATELASALLAA